MGEGKDRSRQREQRMSKFPWAIRSRRDAKGGQQEMGPRQKWWCGTQRGRELREGQMVQGPGIHDDELGFAPRSCGGALDGLKARRIWSD